jgi:hypothetical protein
MVINRPGALVTALAALTMIGADCQGNVVRDPTFRDWCGDTLCAWHVDSGNIDRVPTWSQYDYGVSFVDTPTQISQRSDENEARCLLFTTVADIDPSAQMSVQVDFDDDGTVDATEPLGATQWHKVQAEITAPQAYDGIRFAILKEGTGTAILAEMRIQSTTGCTAPPPPEEPLLLGARCANGSVCASGVCAGIGVCSECSTDRPCSNGASCSSDDFGVMQCAPGQHRGAAGAPCIAGADCAKGTCAGARGVPPAGELDAGACDLDATTSPDNCFKFGARGGICQ